MMQKCKKVICCLLLAALMIGLLSGVAISTVSAAQTTSLVELNAAGKLKLLGRTAPGTDCLLADWPGNGFEMNVSGDGGLLEVGVFANHSTNWIVLVDGEQVYWERFGTSGGTIKVNIPAGEHLVSVIKESDDLGNKVLYCDLTTLSFPGTIEDAPADKDLRIEFIGDSYTAGWGTLGTYAPGVNWTGYDHSFTHGYAYYASQILNADYTLAARGGIGLFDGVSTEQPDQDPKGTIIDIYPLLSGFRPEEGLYDFAKQPDVVIIEIGANDGIKESDPLIDSAQWKQKLDVLTDMVRENNPDAPIVFLTHNATKFRLMMQVVDERKQTDPDLYAFSFAHQGNGSGTKTQYYGHPNAEDSYALAEALVAFLQDNDLVPVEKAAEPAYTDYVYYASENGNDSNDGKSLATAKKTLVGALKQAKSDNASFPAGSRIVVNVEGTIVNNSNGTQRIADIGSVLQTADGKNLPILIQTNNYSGQKAIFDTNHKPSDKNSCIVFACNELIFKDIVFQSTTYTAKGTRDNLFYTGYYDVTFDNVTFAQVGETPTAHTDNGWMVSATHVIGAEAIPAEPTTVTLTFLNGDYTNLDYAAAVRVNSLWRASSAGGNIYSCPDLHSKLVIGEGARMGTVYNRNGTLGLAASTVEVRGGSIQQYHGTANGTSSAALSFAGDVNFAMTRGQVSGNKFFAAGEYVTINGDINNTISGGQIYIRPTASYNGFFFGGRKNVTVNNIHNTISAGNFIVQCTGEDNMDGSFYFGGAQSANIKGNVTNRISGGSFLSLNSTTTTKGNMYFGQLSGTIAGTLTNEISAGTFDLSGCVAGRYYFGACNPNAPISKVVNVIGQKDSDKGPMIKGAEIRMGAGWAQVGTSTAYTAMPDVSQCSDEVVLSNTIYGGFFENHTYLAPTGTTDLSDKYYAFVLGSVENNIYGGLLRGTLYAAGSTEIYGKVTTNIYGGTIANLYGAGDNAVIHDGVELNIYDVTEYYDVNKENAWHFWAGHYNNTATIPVPQTAGRPSLKLTVAVPEETILNTPLAISRGQVLGETVVEVSGGTYPKGFRVDGVTLQNALKEDYMPVDTDGKVLVPDETATETGTTQVCVQRVYEVHSTCDETVAPTYTTDPEKAVARPEHFYVNGLCINCEVETGAPVDLNGDSEITILDAQLLAEAKAGLRTLSDYQWLALGNITVQEYVNYILGR